MPASLAAAAAFSRRLQPRRRRPRPQSRRPQPRLPPPLRWRRLAQAAGGRAWAEVETVAKDCLNLRFLLMESMQI